MIPVTIPVRVAVLVPPRLDAFQLASLRQVLAEPALRVVVALLDARPSAPAFERLRRNLARGRGAFVVVMGLRRLQRGTQPPSQLAEAFLSERGVPVVRANAMSDRVALDQLGAYHVDVMALVGGFGIIREPLLSLAPKGILSYHHGDMRYFRGMPPGFWELYHGVREMGMTVQRLAPGLDCGCPVVERWIPIGPADSERSLRQRAMDASADMMAQALVRLAESGFDPQPLQAYGPVYTLPNLRQWLTLQIRLLVRRLGRPA